MEEQQQQRHLAAPSKVRSRLCVALASLLAVTIPGASAFHPAVAPNRRSTPRIPRRAVGSPTGEEDQVAARTASFTLTKRESPRQRIWRRRRRDAPSTVKYRFDYGYDELVLGGDDGGTAAPTTTTAVVLIQPIGVGIGRWYYGRLLAALRDRRGRSQGGRRIAFLAPDLLGCGTACDPVRDDDGGSSGKGGASTKRLPLLGVGDWAEQIAGLMADYEAGRGGGSDFVRWCVLANGGCTPIALEVGRQCIGGGALFRGNLTQIILSAPPRLPTLLQPANPDKVAKSYRTLSGLPGRLFWWYALRNDGAFVKTFSERNLMSRPEYLGEEWTPHCVETARAYGGRSRYSTFAFLAGSLQVGFCREMFDALCGTDIKVDIIRGGDRRPNKSRSWFWEKRKKKNDVLPPSSVTGPQAPEYPESTVADTAEEESMTLAELLRQNGNGGREIVIGGRRCPAHEDADGFAAALLELLDE